MGNEDRKALKQNLASVSRNYEKEIEIYEGAGELGIKCVKVAQWKSKCYSYFNRCCKTSSIIVVPSDADKVMDMFNFLCSDSKSRGFVFKNYGIVKHMEFLGYSKTSLKVKLGPPPASQNIPYIAYIEEKNEIFICEKVSDVSKMSQCLKNITSMIKYFLALYDREIQGTGVTVIGLLIRQNKQGELVVCSFCDLFSLSYEDFESPSTFKEKWDSIETYECWWDLANPKKQTKLFHDLAAQIFCFMALKEDFRTLREPAIFSKKSQIFKEIYFLYTPQQMDIHFSDAKRLVIKGSYGSGKSLMGLIKLELIFKNLRPDEKIIYINFDYKSRLHILMEKNLKAYTGILSKEIKTTNGIPEILTSPSQLVYVCHNRAGDNLSHILEETVRLNKSTSEISKINYHILVEEYDGETLTRDEAAKITELVKGSGLRESSIILLAQPLIKQRSWNIGKRSFKKETSMFHELQNVFKIVQLEEVLRCSNEICRITKSTQSVMQNKDSVFKTEMGKVTFEQEQQYKENKKNLVSLSMLESNYPDVNTSGNQNCVNRSNDFIKTDETRNHGIDLDQAFERVAPLQKKEAARSKIVTKFDFLCEPKQGFGIKGLKPNLIEFSRFIDLNSKIGVISLALVLKVFIDKNEKTVILHMTEDLSAILKRTFQLLLRLLGKTFSYTEDIEAYLYARKKSKNKLIFVSNFYSVQGMEFDHVVIFFSQSEYYLKYYLPQMISRCTYDLNLVLLHTYKKNIATSSLRKLRQLFSKSLKNQKEETVANMIKELNRECLVKQVFVAECETCESNFDFSISNVINNKVMFAVHSHSDQYKEHLSHLPEYTEVEEQVLEVGDRDSALADAK